MKIILVIIILSVAGYFLWKTIQTKPDDSLPQAVVTDIPTNTEEKINFQSDITTTIPNGHKVNNEKVSVSFKGFGPGKEHVGSFSEINSNLSFGSADNLTGTVIVEMDSLSTDNENVTTHLKTADFFDVSKYPTATFSLESLEGIDAQGANAVGTFTIHGVTKKVSFPVSFNSTTRIYTSKFNIDMKDFGIKQTFANEVIEVSVLVPLN